MNIIFDYNRTLFNPDTQQLYEGVLTLLARLSKNHVLYLVSRKEVGRKQLFKTLGLTPYFKRIEMVEEKTPQLFLDLIGRHDSAVVVGDRVREEIQIGNQLGYTTIWLKQGKFSNEFPLRSHSQPSHTILHLTDLLSLLSII